LYALFKEMYTRFFIHLHCISSHSNGILSLCCLFESLLQAKQPELFLHLRKIHADPLRLVFGWMVSVFAGYLDTHEVLLLWDRIVGFNTLAVLPVFAVAVLEFRAANLFKSTSLSEAEVRLCWEVQGWPCLCVSHCEREEEEMKPGTLYKVTNFVVEQPSELEAKE